jgi:hypothetical protein
LPLSGRGVGVSRKIESGKLKIESERQNTLIGSNNNAEALRRAVAPLWKRGLG